ncbi:MAG: T9SS type A sorting domain-containing protein [Bacteroidetes bacterium]|nr:T9SS type A sorting domain-containing protein [Bacteroidota bacterium]
MLLDLNNQEKSIFEIDSIQLSNIEEIAFQEEESPSNANAESILTLLTWVDFEYSLPEENGNRLNGSSYGTSNNSKFELLKIAPNPANNEIIVSGYLNSINRLEIRDILGKTVYVENIQSINGMIKINVSKFNSGSYFVKIVDQNHNIKVGKFMVAR